MRRLVAIGFRSAELQAIEGAFASQGLREVGFTGEEAEEGIMAEMVVIVEVFVTEGEGVNPLGEHFFDGVVDVALVAAIREAGGETREEVLGPLKSAITTRN